MKKRVTKKIIVALLTGIIATSTAISFTGCGNKTASNDDQTLEIYIQNLGYGTQWLKDEIELFKEQEWVKEKYPNLNIPELQYNSEYGYGIEQIKAGEKVNSTDLFFVNTGYDLQGATDSNGNPYLEKLNDVFESKVPGEEVLYKDKMYEAYEMSSKYDDTYWSTCWSAYYEGFLYNADLFNELGLDVPRTTNEMLALCKKVADLGGKNSAYEKDYTVMMSTSREEAAYWQYMAFPIWWSQYEGLDNYYNYWKGIDIVTGTVDSRDVLKQQGRLESMKVVQEVINKYSFVGAGSIDFIEAQTRFLTGDGLMMVNGDWFFVEMRKTIEGLKERGIDYDIRFMKTPIISSIVNELDTIKDEATLVAVIDAIDNGETSYANVSDEDFARIKEARAVVYTEGYQQQAYIPSYSTSKELAKDFLRFLATDAGINQFMKSTGGATLPFEYNVRTEDPEAYEKFDSIQKYRAEIYEQNPQFILPERYEEFKLAYIGGLKAVPNGTLDTKFSKSSGQTAEEVFKEQIDYYTQARWDSILRDLGR